MFYHVPFHAVYRCALALCICFLALPLVVSAQLTAGDIMFVGYNADGDDGFAIVALVDIPANTVIYFNDNEWNESAIGAGGAFNSNGEGEMRWHTGGSVISAGTVVTFDETNSTSNTNFGATVGTIERSIDLNASDEVLYAFLGTDSITPTTFLTAIANDGFSLAKGSLTNTGLTEGTDAIAMTGDEDVMVYNGATTCNSTVAACAAAIATAGSWSTQDGSGAQDQDATTPDFPDDIPSVFGGTALPIELIYFGGEVVDPHAIRLYWETATEVNNDYFEVYRSNDGEHFKPIGMVPGAGFSTRRIAYELEDSNPNLNQGVLFYRLHQIDFNGTESTFDLLRIDLAENPTVQVYPNPIELGRLYIHRAPESGEATLNDLHGNVLRKLDLSEAGSGFDVSDVPAGLYVLQVVSGPHVKAVRVVVQ